MSLEQSQHLKLAINSALYGNGERGAVINDPGIFLRTPPLYVTTYTLQEGETISFPLTLFAQQEIVINGVMSGNGGDGQDGGSGGLGGNAINSFFAQGMDGANGGNNAAGEDAESLLSKLDGVTGGDGGDGAGGGGGGSSICNDGCWNHDIDSVGSTYYLNPSTLTSILTIARPGSGGGGGGGTLAGMIGGGGGASAGTIFLCAPIIRLGAVAELNCIGGNGGDGGANNSGGGGGGAGGFIVLIYEQLIDEGATLDVSGGTGGAGDGTGDDGSDGQDGRIFKIPMPKSTLT